MSQDVSSTNQMTGLCMSVTCIIRNNTQTSQKVMKQVMKHLPTPQGSSFAVICRNKNNGVHVA